MATSMKFACLDMTTVITSGGQQQIPSFGVKPPNQNDAGKLAKIKKSIPVVPCSLRRATFKSFSDIPLLSWENDTDEVESEHESSQYSFQVERKSEGSTPYSSKKEQDGLEPSPSFPSVLLIDTEEERRPHRAQTADSPLMTLSS